MEDDIETGVEQAIKQTTGRPVSITVGKIETDVGDAGRAQGSDDPVVNCRIGRSSNADAGKPQRNSVPGRWLMTAGECEAATQQAGQERP
ncbi:hypothetical protein [uncultured Azonexus sp.]|uniref:hypothetical protein n=1 Tax=uncultured Azonexus sp. TaxID=520307 RepID=UPI0026055E85|nr:hypothetical protein [uncultured Azonexus sp.]